MLFGRSVDTLRLARMLIECGADVSAEDKDGQTPLHLASREGQLGSRSHAYSSAARMCQPQDKDGLTPLHLASREEQLEVARMLIVRGRGCVSPGRSTA